MSDMIQHYSTAVAVAGALWTLLSVINGAMKDSPTKTVMGKVLDVLSYIARKDASGSVKAPFTGSKPAPEVKP